MERKPLVSIVMPVYNAMPYLEQAVQSIYAQTVTDWELIVIDDCSTDGSWDYLQKVDDTRIYFIRNERRKRQHDSVNHGKKIARGKYIARMDADDLMLPKRIEKQIELIESNTELDVVGCGFFRVKDNMNILTVRRPPSNHQEITCLLLGPLSWIHGPNFYITDGTLLGHSKWFKRWDYDVHIPHAMDFDLMCRSERYSVFGNVIEPLYVYRVGSGSSNSYNSQIIAVYHKAISLCKYGLYKGSMLKSIFGLIALIPRPLSYAVVKTFFHGSINKRGLIFIKVAFEDIKFLKEGLDEIAKVEVPLKKCT